MATIQELLELREEVASKQTKVAEMEQTVMALQEELARLKGEIPTYTCPYCPVTFSTQPELQDHIVAEHPIYAELKPWYKRWAFWGSVAGITALIGGIAAWKKRKR